ncbi:LytTR family DNA-binding domain-containing protein [Maricaulis salignorans]|uniref:DNA-binding response regulator, LytR/AlgR family n=1 Tax=Maricaulis salignorans TaxID=144026 RepID=A0A1G9V1F3_9PROT|nr:LytTR family DNA-binding domain-containing protein [Maricaulis salignorans]SDM66054.1 DNA-binding response regulator, LytR/AlgR family [Maricaulis salignorans]
MTTLDFQNEQAAERRAGLHALLAYSVMTLAFWAVNATSIIMEAAREGVAFNAWEAWFIEGTSAAYLLILCWTAVRPLERRFPVGATRWTRWLPAHIGGLLVFSALHVGAMGLTREALFPILFNHSYQFFEDPLWQTFIYELRKDALSYASVVLILTGFRTIQWHRLEAAAARTEARTHHRVNLKCGGRVMHLAASEFSSAKAAGNYVEARFGEREYLARMTLSELDNLLRDAAVDAVRVHRSWLVNRDMITETVPTGEGDVTLTLSNGETIPGSRRYRDRLAA